MKKIIFIIGSTREKSFNKQLAATAEQMLLGVAEVSYLDFKDLPFLIRILSFQHLRLY